MDKVKGKCYSKVNRGQRAPSDCYATPLSMVRQFLSAHSFDRNKFILEPACGQKPIVRVLRECGFINITHYDLIYTPVEESFKDSKYNFFNESRVFDYIITNPPYRLATEFILKATEICKMSFAFLMPINYLHGQKRYDKIYSKGINGFCLNRVYVFTRMPMLTTEFREDGKYDTGMQVYAWYVFSKNSVRPSVFWINNNDYVIRRKRGNKG